MVLSCSTSDLAAKRISSCSSTALFPVVRWGLSPTQAYGPPCHHASAPAIPCLGRQWGLNSQQQAQHSLHRHYASQPNTPADSGDWETIKSVDENPASSSQAAEGKADSGTPIEHSILVLPLLIASAYSHVNRQYIKMRRRRKWWKKLGGYPRVPGENMHYLPEPAVELWQKVLPLGLIFFCASFNLTILQSLKDAIMVTAGGAEALPFLASFGVLPASVAFFVLYNKLVARLPERAVFYASVLPLLVYYGLFATVVYPIAGTLHPLDLMNDLMPSVPIGLHGLLKVMGNWTYSLFFCMAELWGAVVISVLFWSLANEVCTVDEAKAVYPFMAIGANIALVAAGCFIRIVNHTLSTSFPGDTQLLSLRVLIGTVMAMTAAMFASKAYIDAKILKPAAARATAAGARPKKKKSKGTFAEGLAVLKNSPKIRNLALLVMSYGVGHRLFEFAWKGQLRLLYPTVQGYQSVLADVATYTGMLTLANMVVSRLVFQYLGWGVAASVTPAVMGLAGLVFFGATLAAGLPMFTPEMGAAVAGIGATAGVVTQVFARASKYSLFDPAKEMVYIEMDADEKKQGKAAVDLVGSQIGKSGASWITQAFLLGCGSIAAAMPFTGLIFACVIITWIQATWSLHRQMQQTEQTRLAAAAAASNSGGSSSSSNGDNSGPEGGVAVATSAEAAAAAAAAIVAQDAASTSAATVEATIITSDAEGDTASNGISDADANSGSHPGGTDNPSLNSYVAAAVNGINGSSGAVSKGFNGSVNGVNGSHQCLNGVNRANGVNSRAHGATPQLLIGSERAAKELSRLKTQ